MYPLGDCAGRKLDIAILGDISKSLENEDLRNFRRVVIAMINSVGVSSDGNHFGLITFGDKATRYNLFKSAKYHKADDLKELVRDKIKTIAKKVGTRTDLALSLAANQLFVPDNGDRKDADNLLFLFTDGKPYDGNKKERIDINLFKPLIESLEVSEFS